MCDGRELGKDVGLIELGQRRRRQPLRDDPRTRREGDRAVHKGAVQGPRDTVRCDAAAVRSGAVWVASLPGAKADQARAASGATRNTTQCSSASRPKDGEERQQERGKVEQELEHLTSTFLLLPFRGKEEIGDGPGESWLGRTRELLGRTRTRPAGAEYSLGEIWLARYLGDGPGGGRPGWNWAGSDDTSN
ncbi:hypothetical protein CMUS01_14843 [Colletotrichum musicola]|uniref:Uncharacterized protein n=1 Tax=Colletotrichum musicola TaxID=2175873 RepID=A0A8H6J150_9PEZI|nr:hypothetical protein CMUS01_14843 [Colletotrichum musicola]